MITTVNLREYLKIETRRVEDKKNMWAIDISFNRRKHSFLYETENDPLDGRINSVLQQILTCYEDFGRDVPSLETYTRYYFGKDEDVKIAKEDYKKTIVEKYEPAIKLFGEHVGVVYESCLNRRFPNRDGIEEKSMFNIFGY